jgi:hypothetical protein
VDDHRIVAFFTFILTFAPNASAIPPELECTPAYTLGKSKCTAAKLSEWRYSVTPSSSNVTFGPYASLSAAIAAGIAYQNTIFTSPPNTGCSVVFERTDPPYVVGTDNGQVITYGIALIGRRTGYTDGNPACTSVAVGTAGTISQNRSFSCPAAVAGEGSWAIVYE